MPGRASRAWAQKQSSNARLASPPHGSVASLLNGALHAEGAGCIIGQVFPKANAARLTVARVMEML